MAELVGGAFLSSFLNVLIDRMASRPVFDFISGKKNNNELLMRELKIKLLTANKLVDDAEEKQMTSPIVRKWLDDLKDAIYCVGELLDEINTEALRRQLEGEDVHSPAATSRTSWIMRSVFKSSSPSDEFHNSLESKISNILRVLDLILNEKDVLGLKEGVQHRPQDTTRQTTSRVDESGIFGREKDRETILKALRSDDTTGAKIGVLPIVGMGGIGKSTLAQLVYKDVKDDFDVQAWVCVGEEFDLKILQIAQIIYGKITDQTCGITDLDLLSERLEKVLTGKKFLFVLDDVWSEDYLRWNDLMTHFNRCGVHGSKIIVTTRQGRVASITGTLSTHYLQVISEDDSWLLFAKHAFTEDTVITAHPDLEVIGRQVVKKCQGLPLAIKSLGGLLHSFLNRREWENILKSDLWELPNEKVLPALWLSYQYLPPHLKRCFAYCAIFPKGYKCPSSVLISWWMAEDFLQPHGKEALEDVGSDYFDALVSRSFFQHSINEDGMSFFTMHDLMNDLAKFVAGEFCLRLEENQPPNKNLCKTRHFSFKKFGGHGIQKFEALDEAKHLHTFLKLECEYEDEDCNKLVLKYTLVNLLPNLPCLRVLRLSGDIIVELPSSIGNLKQLRHLDVTNAEIRELPETVCTLYNLQTLLLNGCERLIQLPSNLGRLINLRHLHISGTRIKKMPAKMCNLKNLQRLSDFVVDKQTAQRIGELKELQHLRGDLTISGVGNIDHKGNALEADIMSNKEYLDQLVLTWGRGYDASTHDPENDREVLNKLQPHTNLKQLVIRSYGGVSFPGWLGDPSFSKLSCIELKDFQHCCLLPPLGQLPSLKQLHVLGMNNVVEIGSEFPNLRELVLKNCPKLTEILPLEKLQSLERIELRGLESFSGSLSHVESECPKFLSLTYLKISECPNFVCFPDGGMDAPKLEELLINRCKKLRSLPEKMHTLLPSLQKLEVLGCPEVESFPQGGGIMFPNLRELVLKNCPKLTEILPLEKLQSLERIELCGLESFSGSLSHVESECPQFLSLAHLAMYKCPNLVCFPDGGMDAPKLKNLYISGCKKLRSLPKQMHTLLPSLQKLRVSCCPEVESLPLEKLQSLERVELCRLESFNGSLSHVESECPQFLSLAHLEIDECPNFVCFPDGGMDAPKLKKLYISGCKKLRSLPEQMHTLLPSLQKLRVFDCPEVESFPQGGLPSNLRHLSFECCRKLAAKRSLWGLTRLNSLRKLEIRFSEEGGEELGCSFPEEGLLPATLTSLYIRFHPNLTTIQGKVLRQLTSLEDLIILGCPELQGFAEEAPKSLKSLTIWECPNIGCLPGEWLPTSLSRLEIRRCPLLEERFRRETGEDWPKISHIPNICISNSFPSD